MGSGRKVQCANGDIEDEKFLENLQRQLPLNCLQISRNYKYKIIQFVFISM
jgi:hypothetical protein